MALHPGKLSLTLLWVIEVASQVAEDSPDLLVSRDLVCTCSLGVTVGKIEGTLGQLKLPLTQA